MHSFLARILNQIKTPSIPPHLRRRQSNLNPGELVELEQELRAHYFSNRSRDYLTSEAGQRDLNDHLDGRLNKDRHYIIPWLASLTPLDDIDILEIGSGTGASTVAMGEQGAHVSAVDIDAASLEVARKRCDLHKVDASFTVGNAADLPAPLREGRFDLVVFYASLEHMTHQERLTAIVDTWPLVKPGGHWCVIGTPNRLWHFDYHTSFLPFYFWLPDDLAYHFSKHSDRPDFGARYRDPPNEERMLDFLRRGRGVSYHEFELALGSLNEVEIPRGLASYHRHRSLRALKHACTLEGKYERLLRKLAPEIPEVFLHKSLDFALKQPSTNITLEPSKVSHGDSQ